MFSSRDSEILEALKSVSIVGLEELDALVKTAFETGNSLADVLISENKLSETAFLRAVADHLEMEFIDSDSILLSDVRAHSHLLPRKAAYMYGAMVVGSEADRLKVVVIDPFDTEIHADLEHVLGAQMQLHMTEPGWVEAQLEAIYPEDISVDAELGKLGPSSSSENATLIDYVDMLIQKAIQDGASDIHFEPFETVFRIRYRVDGSLREIPSHANHLGTAIASRIKVMARLNIAETRIPQDGRIQFHALGRNVDIRVSTLPTQFGESVVLRILDKTKVNLDLNMLGMPEDILDELRRAIHTPNGIFLATGPTGSGKTTTLYSALRELNRPGSKLLTVEDPVEYDIDGIVQVQTNALIGLDFARSLRAFLRHDPDKILLGEIRDTETAKIAVQASLTGHMVFSSLHTNDAAGAVTRFVDMGVEPYLVAASLVAVLAQRLLRRLNLDFCEAYFPEDYELEQLGYDPIELKGGQFMRKRPEVSETDYAYRGRVGLYELINVDDPFRELITRQSSHGELTRFAIQQGMRSLRKDGLRALLAGSTSVEEVLRYT
jgi:type IV pilus assembly protein PilB